MTKERKEQLSNRLVMNFGILLAGALVLLYINSALRSAAADLGYWITLGLAVVGLVGAVLFFVLGTVKKSKLRNYSGIFLGVLIGSLMVYISKLGWIPGYTNVVAVVCVYITMAVYFIVMAIITAILLHKPTIKTEAELLAIEKRKAIQKKKKRRK